MKFMKETEATIFYMINVARTSRKIPELREAIASGDVEVSKAAQLCRVITKDNKAEWIEKATDLSKKDLEVEIAKAHPEQPQRPPDGRESPPHLLRRRR